MCHHERLTDNGMAPRKAMCVWYCVLRDELCMTIFVAVRRNVCGNHLASHDDTNLAASHVVCACGDNAQCSRSVLTDMSHGMSSS